MESSWTGNNAPQAQETRPPLPALQPPPAGIPAKVPKGSGKAKGGGHRRSTSSAGWSLSDPEVQRKKRVAAYKVYSVEGKVKRSVRKGFRWIKEVVFGWR